MAITAKDVIPLTQARSRLSEIADEVKTGSGKIITKNGESYVALIDADRLDYYHRLERERIHLMLLDEAERGLLDVAEGRLKDARQAVRRLQAQAQRRVRRNGLLKKTAVKITANFEANLASIEAFFIEGDAPQAYDLLLDNLLNTVIPNFEQFPKAGSTFPCPSSSSQ